MKYIYIIIFLFLGMFTSCQNKEIKLNNAMKNNRLVDGINLENTVFKKNDIDLNKYKYDGTFIENLCIDNLLKEKYRSDFIKYLLITKTEDDNFKSTLITQLLIIRIIQLSDSNAFYILSELSKNETISYNGVELYPDILMKFFIENPTFFIEQGSKYNDTTIIAIILNSFDEFIADEDFFKSNMASINLENNQLLLYPEKEQRFNETFKKILNSLPKSEAVFSPSLYTAWENKTIYFTNISSILGPEITSNLTIKEKLYYKLNILPVLKKYTHFGYIIEDSDGYTNLREDKNSSSKILQQIISGSEIEVLDSSGDWWYVQTKEEKRGYIYKTKIKTQ